MSARVKVPEEDAMRMVDENLGWKRSSEGPAGKGMLAVMRGAKRRSYTCISHQLSDGL